MGEERAGRVVLFAGEDRIVAAIAAVTKHVLYLSIDALWRPKQSGEFVQAALDLGARSMPLGRVRFELHPSHPRRRDGDPPPRPGDGVLLTLDEVFDFDKLLRKGLVSSLTQHVEQLPMIWQRRQGIRPAFVALVADTIYDLQSFRAIFDEIDRNLEGLEPGVANIIRDTVIRTRYEDFSRLFDAKLNQLETMVSSFGREEHEQHGFYLRKQVWDLALSSAFMARTNLKPRGYAGDSEMMRMIYDRGFVGNTTFERFMHHHPIESHAAQAVRNRVALLGEMIGKAVDARGAGTKILSVACGPAHELRHAFTTPSLTGAVDLTLLDQDDSALAEAAEEIDRIALRTGVRPNVRFAKESVRRMLASADLDTRFGGQNLIYSMGLFDYLTAPVAKAVLAKLLSLLAPNGEMIIGNFHVSNPTRVYMEYWMDWVLFYRSEADFHALCSDFTEAASVDVFFEDTKSQMFLRVTKNG